MIYPSYLIKIYFKTIKYSITFCNKKDKKDTIIVKILVFSLKIFGLRLHLVTHLQE